MARQRKSATPKAARRRERKRRAGVQVRRKKEYTYRGVTVTELKALSLEEFLELMPSRQRRSFTRGLTREQAKIIRDAEADPDSVIRTHRREMIVIPQFIGRKFAIYDGHEFVEVEVQPEMVGHYFGEFAQTRTPPTHTGPGVGATRSSKFMPLK
jgi:small subunit ribosomal protein S19